MNSTASRKTACRSSLGRQRREAGVATLIVVMVLFFVVSMVAAYTSRNLLFEQKTSANQLRATTAYEAAEAGLQWAIGMLNSGRIDTACVPSSNVADTSFRQRYLTISDTTGTLAPITKTTVPPTPLLPSCVFNGVDWNCSCPVNGDPAVAAPAGSDVFPAFRLRLTAVPAPRDTLVWVEVNGCTRYADSCLSFPASGSDSEGRATVSALVTLKGAITTPPIAALTARGLVAPGAGSALTVVNTNPKTGGLTVHSGSTIDKTLFTAKSTPGTPPALSFLENDPSLQFTAYPPATLPTLSKSAAMFLGNFGMAASTYETQQGAVVLTCNPCTADQIRLAAARNPLRVIWVNGEVSFDTAGDVGSASEPIALVVTGSVSFAVPVTFYGIVYSRADPWTLTGAGTIVGAAVAENGLAGISTASIVYDADILTRLRYTTGSFAMVPGSWRDF